ncbi:MAG: hypothetical protein AAGH46_08685, partial [Bacteroidota bacterium]
MEKHLELTDKEFEKQFRNCDLKPSYFTHEAHLRLAWISINELGAEKAEKTIQDLILKFVDHHGARDKYNLTLTVAATRMI